MFRGNASALAPGMLTVSYPCDLLLIICFSCLYSNLILGGDSGSFEYEPCLARNRRIHHLAIHGTHALSIHHKYLACLGHLFFSRGQDFVDDRDLCRMNCAFAMKAKTRRSFCLRLRPFTSAMSK